MRRLVAQEPAIIQNSFVDDSVRHGVVLLLTIKSRVPLVLYMSCDAAERNVALLLEDVRRHIREEIDGGLDF